MEVFALSILRLTCNRDVETIEQEGKIMEVLVFAAAIYAVIICIAWIVLPFAVFGIKARLDDIIKLMERKVR
jgi:branched-subunit amino acid transport protein AzlD